MIENQKHLKQIQQNMPVYDSAGEKVGKVSFVYPGADEYIADWSIVSSDTEATNVPHAVLDELPNGSPDEVNERLLQLGFIKIKTGLLSPTRYALPDHIAQVQIGKVHLSVKEDALPTF